MVHPPLNVILLSSVTLGSLIVVPRLLLLLLLLGGLPLPTITGLAWRTLGIPVGTSVSKVPKLTTLEASIASRKVRGCCFSQGYRLGCSGDSAGEWRVELTAGSAGTAELGAGTDTGSAQN